jgi:hypothetical protein
MKARITVGASVIELEGEPEQISKAILRLNGGAAVGTPRRRALKAGLWELLGQGFFLRPRALADIREELAGKGVAFGASSLYPALYKDFLTAGLVRKQGRRGNYLYYCKPQALEVARRR